MKFKPGMRSINKVVVDMVTAKLDNTNFKNSSDISKLTGWLNGVAVPERNPELKAELKRLRQIAQQLS